MTKKRLLPKVSVNLVTWNAHAFLNACLDSLQAQTYPHWELFVIDNASSDNTVALVKACMPKVSLLENVENVGFAAAHNEAIRQSDGQYILMLNQDIILDKHFLKRAVSYLESHRPVGALQPKLIRYDFVNNASLGVIDTTGLVVFKNRRIVNRGQGLPDKGEYKEGEVFGADGAAPVYRRKALEEVAIPREGKKGVEYLDEDFFSYKEDVDLAWRLRLAGWKAVYVPSVKAFHGRGSGDSASTKALDIIRERRKISTFSKVLSWRNQRLMQIKNEQLGLFIRHLPYILPKEIAAWLYIFLFEPATARSLPSALRALPKAWRKRYSVQKRRKVTARQMSKWFT